MKKPRYLISPYKANLWGRQCDICHAKFINELMWYIKINELINYLPNFGHFNKQERFYFCRNCCPTEQDAYEMIYNYENEHYKLVKMRSELTLLKIKQMLKEQNENVQKTTMDP